MLAGLGEEEKLWRKVTGESRTDRSFLNSPNKLVATSLETGDDLTDELARDTVRLDHDERALVLGAGGAAVGDSLAVEHDRLRGRVEGEAGDGAGSDEGSRVARRGANASLRRERTDWKLVTVDCHIPRGHRPLCEAWQVQVPITPIDGGN